MMNLRNQILSVLLAIQILLGIVVFWPRSTASGAEAGPLLADFSAEDVVSLIVTDSDGNRVTLTKDSQGWVLPEADDFPADDEKVSSLLEKLGSIQTNRQVTRTESSHKRLKVAENDFARLIELGMADGSSYTLYVGSSPQSSATHVRLGVQPETYLTGELASYEANATAARWIDTIYYTVPQTATVVLTLTNENGEFEFERDEADEWTLKGLAEDETFMANNLRSLLTQSTSLNMVSPIGKEEEDWFELDQPRAVLTLRTEDDQVYTLRIGAKEKEDNNYVAKWSGSPYYVLVAEYTADNFINKTRDDFIELPPPPAPEAGGGSAEETPANGD